MIKRWLRSYKNTIFTVENKVLTKGSKVSLFFFVVIIFLIIGSGLKMQRSYITTPYANFGRECVTLLDKSKKIREFQDRDITKDIYGAYFKYKFWSLSDFKYNHHRNSERDILDRFGKNKLCVELGTLFLNVGNSHEYRDRLILLEALNKKKARINSQLSQKRNEYSESLLEVIAKQEQEYSVLSINSKTVKSQLHTLRDKLSELTKLLEKSDNVDTLPDFLKLMDFIDSKSEEITEKHQSERKYYRFKYTLNTFVFLFPIWLLFYFLYRILKKRYFYISSHLSINVANVSAIYILFNIFSIIYSIIPHVFLSKVINFLSNHNLSVVINIVAILIFMGIFGIFIFKIQKNKMTDDENTRGNDILEEKLVRIQNGFCSNCGTLPEQNSSFCGQCSTQLTKVCNKCNNTNKVDNLFCSSCASSLVS